MFAGLFTGFFSWLKPWRIVFSWLKSWRIVFSWLKSWRFVYSWPKPTVIDDTIISIAGNFSCRKRNKKKK